LRRIIIAATAIVALAAAAVAYATTTSNTYTAKFSFNQKGNGTAKSPVPVGFSETLTAANSVSGMRAAPLTDIQVSLTGLKANPKPFPTCSAAKILAAKSDTGCPKGALVATGGVTAQLGDNTLTGAGTPCTPILDVWNAGGGKLNFFFVISGSHQCGGLQTGSTAPYTGTLVQHGNTLVQNTPLPPDVSTDAGNIGAYGSLTLESLKWLKLTTKVNGKTVPFLESTGCSGGSHSVSVAFTATDAASEMLTGSATGSGKC
jgi:hypothetical protein